MTPFFIEIIKLCKDWIMRVDSQKLDDKIEKIEKGRQNVKV